jgi:glucosyl-3-phosphoglycerate phosphatase
MILIRHGQSEFNVHFAATRRDPGIVDPPLTEHGHVQAREAAFSLRKEGIRRIIASPYTRALQTATSIASVLSVPIVVHPIVRERYAFVCDVGSGRADLVRCWPEHDFSGVQDIWWPAIEEPAASITARAALFRAEMAELPDWSDTLVVSHWGFILCMTGQSVANCEWLRCDPTDPGPKQIEWRA